MVAIGPSGNKIGNDSNGNLVLQTISGKIIEISCIELLIKHKLKLDEDFEICGNIISTDLDNKLDTINQTIASISGGSQAQDLTNLNTKITTLSGNVFTLSGNVFTLDGQLQKEGYSDVIDCAGLAVGAYVVLITSATQVSRLPLQIIH